MLISQKRFRNWRINYGNVTWIWDIADKDELFTNMNEGQMDNLSLYSEKKFGSVYLNNSITNVTFNFCCISREQVDTNVSNVHNIFVFHLKRYIIYKNESFFCGTAIFMYLVVKKYGTKKISFDEKNQYSYTCSGKRNCSKWTF